MDPLSLTSALDGGGARDSAVVEALCHKRKVAVSRPEEVNDFSFNLPIPSSRTRPWGLLNL
jgi:hypothetical protein